MGCGFPFSICICGPGNLTFFGPFSLTEIYCQGLGLTEYCAEDLGAAVGPPWLGTEAPDHQQTIDI